MPRSPLKIAHAHRGERERRREKTRREGGKRRGRKKERGGEGEWMSDRGG